MTSPSLRLIVRLSAWYDLVVAAGFALPFTAPSVITGLAGMHQALELSGAAPDASESYMVMFANLMGSLVVVWAVFRLLRPTRAAGAADTVARGLFAIGMAAALMRGASSLVAVMLVLELVWAVTQGLAVLSARRELTVVGSLNAYR